MEYALILIGLVLVVYFVLWRIYLLIAPRVTPEDWPDYVRKPKFWQFLLIVFAFGAVRKKLDI